MLAFLAQAFNVPSSKVHVSPIRMALADYKEELAKTAKAIAAPGMLCNFELFSVYDLYSLLR